MSVPTIDKSRLSWWLIGAALALAVGFVVYSFVGTFVFGVFIYYATRPIYRRLRRRIGRPNVAASIAIFLLVLPALVLVAYAALIVFRELDRVTRNSRFDPTDYGLDPGLLDRIADPEALLSGGFSRYFSSDAFGSVLGSVDSAVGTVAVVGIALIHLFVMTALAFYLLRDDHRIARWFYLRFGDDRGVLETYFRTVDEDFNSIFFGNILNAVLTGTIGVISYSALNVFAPPSVPIPAAALVGALAGVASLVPVVGMKLVYLPVAALMAAEALLFAPDALWFVALFALVSLVIVDTIPDLVLRPYVSGRNLHVGAVMIAYTLGPLLFGWYGIFLMPMLLVLVVHFARIVLPELLAGAPIRPYAVDPSHIVDDRTGDPFPDAGGMGDGADAAGNDAPSDSRPENGPD